MLSRFSQTENGKIKAPADLVVGKGLLPHSELIFFFAVISHGRREPGSFNRNSFVREIIPLT